MADPLKVGPVPPKRFLEEFQWDIAKYPNRRPLPELVQLILGVRAACLLASCWPDCPLTTVPRHRMSRRVWEVWRRT